MAKKSVIFRNIKRMDKANKYRAYRKELRLKVSNPTSTPEEKYEAGLKLQKLPRNTASARCVSRCRVTGRPKGVLRKFQMSRLSFREMASRGLIPGVTKASW